MMNPSPAPHAEEPIPSLSAVPYTMRERVGAGLAAAFIYALIGGVLWLGLHYVGFPAWLGAIVAVKCAVKGYENYAHRLSYQGIVLATVMALLSVVIAWYLCLSDDVYQAQIAWFEAGKTGYKITFFDAMAGAYTRLLDPKTAWDGWRDLVIGGALCVGIGVLELFRFRALLKDIQSHNGVFVDPPFPNDVYIDPPHVFDDPPAFKDDM